MKRFIVSLVLILGLVTGCGNTSSAAVSGVAADGTIVGKSSIAACNTAPGIKECRITTPQTMTANITLANDRSWKLGKGAVITTTGYTFDVNNAPFEAGDYQVFAGSGTVTGLKNPIPEWFGVNTTPGTTDMTTAITKAIASIGTTYYGVVDLSSYYLISSNISVPAGVTLRGLSSSGTRIYKSAAMTTTGITLAGFNSQLENISVMTDLGATGDGIQIAAANTVLRNVVVHGAVKTTPSGNGIRIGLDAGPSNCNNWRLDNVRVTGMSGHGVYVHDKPGFNPDANAGTATHVETNDNGGDGIKEDNGWLNTYVGQLSQSNTNGIHFATSSKYATLVGGDREANSNKDILIDSTAVQTSLSGINITENISDSSTTTRRLERQIQKMGTWLPALVGDVTSGTQTYSVQAGWYFRHGDLVTVQGRIGLSAKDAATAGNMRITGLPFACATITNGFFPVAFSSWGAFTFPANFTAIGGNVSSATSYITLNRNGSAQTATAIAASEVGAAAVLIFSVTYPVASF